MNRPLLPFFALRLHLPLMAALLVTASFVINNQDVRWLTVISAALLTASIYLANRVTDVAEDSINAPAETSVIRLVGSPALLTIAGICWIAAVGTALREGVLPVFSVGLATIGGGLYSWKGPLSCRLKSRPFLKNVLPAAIWALITTGPIYFMPDNAQLHSSVAVLTSLSVFLMALEIEVAWDFRDIPGDRATGIATLAQHSSKSCLQGLSITVSFAISLAVLGCWAIGTVPAFFLSIIPFRLWIIWQLRRYYSAGDPADLSWKSHSLVLSHGLFLGVILFLALRHYEH